MGVSLRRAGCITSAEECSSQSRDIDVDRSPHPAAKIKETAARGVNVDYRSSETTWLQP
jgi:hypothetical protein